MVWNWECDSCWTSCNYTINKVKASCGMVRCTMFSGNGWDNPGLMRLIVVTGSSKKTRMRNEASCTVVSYEVSNWDTLMGLELDDMVTFVVIADADITVCGDNWVFSVVGKWGWEVVTCVCCDWSKSVANSMSSASIGCVTFCGRRKNVKRSIDDLTCKSAKWKRWISKTGGIMWLNTGTTQVDFNQLLSQFWRQ